MNYLTFPELERVGRLGNSLWQIASTLGLARRHGLAPRFPASWSYRRFFSIPDEFFEPTGHALSAWRMNDLDHLDPRTRIYMQDLSFIEGVEDEIHEWFQPSEEAERTLLPLVKDGARSLVLHVRRGDNVYAQHAYPLPSIDYYLDAVRRHPGFGVLICGDDWEWNRSVLHPEVEKLAYPVFTFAGTPRPKEHEPNYMTAPILDWIDLQLMASLGRAFCLSNSTLGWWSAWLSGSDDVCYPDPWYGPALDVRQEGYIDGSLMMPKPWERERVR